MTESNVVPITPERSAQPTLDNVHPLALHLPLMQGTEFDKLVADIQANGLVDPVVVLPDGRLLDGRNRVRACNHLGRKIATWVYEGAQDDVSILRFILSKNLHRRHLTTAQANKLALDVEPVFAAEAKKRQAAGQELGRQVRNSGSGPTGPEPTPEVRARDQAAATVPGATGRGVQRAKAVEEKGVPELQEAVFGASPLISLTRGEEIAKQPPAQQREAVAEAKEETKTKASDRDMRPRLAEEFGDGKWRPVDEIAEAFDRPIDAVKQALDRIIWEMQPPKLRVERKQVGPSWHYKIFKSAKGVDRVVSSAELEQKLRPIIKALKELGTKNSVTICIAHINECAVDLKNALDDWTK